MLTANVGNMGTYIHNLLYKIKLCQGVKSGSRKKPFIYSLQNIPDLTHIHTLTMADLLSLMGLSCFELVSFH